VSDAPHLSIGETCKELGCGRTTLYTRFLDTGLLQRYYVDRRIVLARDEVANLAARIAAEGNGFALRQEAEDPDGSPDKNTLPDEPTPLRRSNPFHAPTSRWV
jgi:hypothetical protein